MGDADEKRYREALEAIASAKCGDNRKHCHHMGEICRTIARRALTSPADLGGPTPGGAKEATCGAAVHAVAGGCVVPCDDHECVIDPATGSRRTPPPSTKGP